MGLWPSHFARGDSLALCSLFRHFSFCREILLTNSRQKSYEILPFFSIGNLTLQYWALLALSIVYKSGLLVELLALKLVFSLPLRESATVWVAELSKGGRVVLHYVDPHSHTNSKHHSNILSLSQIRKQTVSSQHILDPETKVLKCSELEIRSFLEGEISKTSLYYPSRRTHQSYSRQLLPSLWHIPSDPQNSWV